MFYTEPLICWHYWHYLLWQNVLLIVDVYKRVWCIKWHLTCEEYLTSDPSAQVVYKWDNSMIWVVASPHADFRTHADVVSMRRPHKLDLFTTKRAGKSRYVTGQETASQHHSYHFLFSDCSLVDVCSKSAVVDWNMQVRRVSRFW